MEVDLRELLAVMESDNIDDDIKTKAKGILTATINACYKRLDKSFM